jgi:hypothetical protein
MCKVNPMCRARRCECSKWSRRLDDDGLGTLDVDVYREPDMIAVSNRGSGKMDDDKDHRARLASEELAEQDRDITRHHVFKHKRDRQAWTLHASGLGLLQVSRALGISFRQARNSVERTRSEWRLKQRRPVKVTKDLIDATDPLTLLALLRVAT